jgi:hypothetical protein
MFFGKNINLRDFSAKTNELQGFDAKVALRIWSSVILSVTSQNADPDSQIPKAFRLRQIWIWVIFPLFAVSRQDCGLSKLPRYPHE